MLRDTETRLRPSWLLLGPAFVAAIAYVDPGNVAANVSAGAQFGFLLVWVIFLANAMAGTRAVPVGKTGPGQRPHPARGRRRPHPHAHPDRLLAAGRIGRHGNRSRRGGRRRHRAVPAVRPAAAGRRHHHRRGVAAAAGRPEPPRPTDVRTGHQRPAADHRDRIPHQPVRRAAHRSATSPPGWCRASTAPRACCWPPRCWARRSCRTPSTCTPAWPATGTATPSRARNADGCCGSPARRRAGDAGGRRGEPVDAAGRRHQPAGPGQHRLHRGRARRRAGHARARPSRCSSPSGCSPRGSRRRRSAHTPGR